MPVSKKQSDSADLRNQAASKMQIDLKYVFFVARGRRVTKPTLAIWTEGWTEEEIQRVRALKPEVKAMAAAVGAKIYMSPIHPRQKEAHEAARRRSRGPEYRNREKAKRSASDEAKASARIDLFGKRIITTDTTN